MTRALSIIDGHGNEVTTGLEPDLLGCGGRDDPRVVAQQAADRLGGSVWLVGPSTVGEGVRFDPVDERAEVQAFVRQVPRGPRSRDEEKALARARTWGFGRGGGER